jgi:bifunctional non-homologous end joining protein LigD
MALPNIGEPMAATQIAKPFHRPGWVYEEKVDGWRVLAYKDAAGVRLVSRNAKDLTRWFPELVAAVAALKPPTLLLDGEIAVFDSQLLSHFEWIRAQPKGEFATRPTLIAFDCLYMRGKDLRKRPLRVRRNVLEDLVDGQPLVLPARRLADDGLEAWAQVVERRYEGLVGKDEASPYVESRTLAWLKVKVPHYREVERGWEPRKS